MSNLHFTNLVQHAFKESKNMAPVGKGKTPLVGFMAGFLFGPIGVGVYLGSMPDFVMSLGMVIVGTLMTVTVGAPFFWVLCGVWAYMRIRHSNSQTALLEARNATVDEPVPQQQTPVSAGRSNGV